MIKAETNGDGTMLYHASQTAGIETLEPRTSNEGVPRIYFSDKRENVLVYLSNAVEKTCREHGVISKVILETCYLTDEQKVRSCELAVKAGVDFVKTSTGFGTGGATAADIALMRRTVGPDMGVKAAGGIRDLAAAFDMIRAGATRIGTSAGVAIVEELKKSLKA